MCQVFLIPVPTWLCMVQVCQVYRRAGIFFILLHLLKQNCSCLLSFQKGNLQIVASEPLRNEKVIYLQTEWTFALPPVLKDEERGIVFNFFHAQKQAIFHPAFIFPIQCKFNSKKQTSVIFATSCSKKKLQGCIINNICCFLVEQL